MDILFNIAPGGIRIMKVAAAGVEHSTTLSQRKIDGYKGVKICIFSPAALL